MAPGGGHTIGGLTPRLVQLIHRHGDRSTITRVESQRVFWRAQLPTTAQRAAAAAGTAARIARLWYVDQHPGGGDAEFGQLTAKGLEQMQAAGARLREEVLEAGGAPALALQQADVSQVAVACTEFNRTMVSVQGLLHGLLFDLLPPGDSHADVVISTNGSDVLIPDPEPRWPGQAEAEAAVWGSEEVLAREASMTPLRERVAAVLEAEDLLGAPSEQESTAGVPQPSWGRLAEILKCLQVHTAIPTTIPGIYLTDCLWCQASVRQAPGRDQPGRRGFSGRPRSMAVAHAAVACARGCSDGERSGCASAAGCVCAFYRCCVCGR